MIWYRVATYGDEIHEVEVAKETDVFLIDARGQRTAKSSEYCEHFRTEDEAVASMQARAAQKLERAQEQYDAVHPRSNIKIRRIDKMEIR